MEEKQILQRDFMLGVSSPLAKQLPLSACTVSMFSPLNWKLFSSLLRQWDICKTFGTGLTCCHLFSTSGSLYSSILMLEWVKLSFQLALRE